MSQYDFGIIDPSVHNGTQLAGFINGFRDAVNSGHSGKTRPDYIRPGMSWVDTSSATAWKLNLFDGTADVLIASVNPNTHALTNLIDTYLKVDFKADGSANAPILYGAAGEVFSKKLVVSRAAGGQGRIDLQFGSTLKWILLHDQDDTFKLYNKTTEKTALNVDPNTSVTDFVTMPTVGGVSMSGLFGGAKPKAWRSFSASGNYTPTSGTKFILISAQGGGGGGGGAYGNPGGSGASAGTSHSFAPVTEGATYPVVVGGGGYNASGNNNGGDGGNSTVTIDGVVYGATGGGGGLRAGSSPASPGGAYGTAFFGLVGAGGNTSSTNGSNAGAGQPWWMHGGYFGQGGTGQGSNYGSTPGAAGHVEILEFGA